MEVLSFCSELIPRVGLGNGSSEPPNRWNCYKDSIRPSSAGLFACAHVFFFFIRTRPFCESRGNFNGLDLNYSRW